MKKLLTLSLIAVVAFGVLTTFASADLIMNVKAVDGTGYTVADDGKTVQLTNATAAVNFQVWATISGTTSTELITITGGVQQIHGPGFGTGSKLVLPTNPPKGYIAPYDDMSIQAVNVTDDLLGNNGATTSNGSLVYMNIGAYPGPATQTIELGTFTYSAVAGGLDEHIASINYVKPGSKFGNAFFIIDGVPYQGKSDSGLPLISAGTPVEVYSIPEPSSFVLLGISALALLFVRRWK